MNGPRGSKGKEKEFMKIDITGICSFMGRPAAPGDKIETQNRTEEIAAEYLVSIGKATKVLEVSAQEQEATDERADDEEED